VSVRLHGALGALGAGHPAIHLSYQRKGWASYSDLGLGEYVHSARRFDPSLVAQQIALLQEDPSRLWNRLSAQYGKLAEASKELDRLIGRCLTVKR
jgi:polysaccharide pyruvyl transferase WcaK-like protein